MTLGCVLPPDFREHLTQVSHRRGLEDTARETKTFIHLFPKLKSVLQEIGGVDVFTYQSVSILLSM